MIDLEKTAGYHNHKADQRPHEDAVISYLIQNGIEGHRVLRAIGMNRNLIRNEVGYHIYKACDSLNDDKLLLEGNVAGAVYSKIASTNMTEVRSDTTAETLVEHIGGPSVILAFTDMPAYGERAIADAVGSIKACYQVKAEQRKLYEMQDLLKDPSASISDVVIKAASDFKEMKEHTVQVGGLSIDDATQDALKAHDFMKQRAESGAMNPTWTMDQLDADAPILPGTFIGVWGAPASGKTTFVLQMAIESAKQPGCTVQFVSWEMSGAQLGAKRICYESGGNVDFSALQRGTLDKAGRDLAEQYEGLESLEIIADGKATVEWLESHLGALAARVAKPSMVIFDHMHFLRPTNGRDLYQTLTLASGMMAEFVRDTGIPIIVLLQATTEARKQNRDNSGNIKSNMEPSPNDIRGSGDIYADLHVLMMLWNREPESPDPHMTLKIAKNRWGPEVKVDCTFKKRMSLFCDERMHTGGTDVLKTASDNNKRNPKHSAGRAQSTKYYKAEEGQELGSEHIAEVERRTKPRTKPGLHEHFNKKPTDREDVMK